MPPVEEQEVEHVIQRVNLQRALVVGVGGCGAEVIKRLRRLLVDRFGRFENIPIVKFFYIDTDQNWLQTMATEVEEDIRLPEYTAISVTDISLTIPGSLWKSSSIT